MRWRRHAVAGQPSPARHSREARRGRAFLLVIIIHIIYTHYIRLQCACIVINFSMLVTAFNWGDDLIQVHCCVTMMNWQGIELIAQH